MKTLTIAALAALGLVIAASRASRKRAWAEADLWLARISDEVAAGLEEEDRATCARESQTRTLVVLDQFGRAGGVMTGVPVSLTADQAYEETQQRLIAFHEDLREFHDGETEADLQEPYARIPFSHAA